MQKTVTVPFMLLGILFNICLVASNLLETKVVQVGGITATAGLIVFPISYIINDCIAEVWGFKKARLIIWSGFASNFLVIAFAQLAVLLPGRPFLGGGGRFQFRLRDGPTYSGRQLDSVFGRFFPERLCDEQNENRLQRKEFLVTSDRIYPYR